MAGLAFGFGVGLSRRSAPVSGAAPSALEFAMPASVAPDVTMFVSPYAKVAGSAGRAFRVQPYSTSTTGGSTVGSPVDILYDATTGLADAAQVAALMPSNGRLEVTELHDHKGGFHWTQGTSNSRPRVFVDGTGEACFYFDPFQFRSMSIPVGHSVDRQSFTMYIVGEFLGSPSALLSLGSGGTYAEWSGGAQGRPNTNADNSLFVEMTAPTPFNGVRAHQPVCTGIRSSASARQAFVEDVFQSNNTTAWTSATLTGGRFSDSYITGGAGCGRLMGCFVVNRATTAQEHADILAEMKRVYGVYPPSGTTKQALFLGDSITVQAGAGDPKSGWIGYQSRFLDPSRVSIWAAGYSGQTMTQISGSNQRNAVLSRASPGTHTHIVLGIENFANSVRTAGTGSTPYSGISETDVTQIGVIRAAGVTAGVDAFVTYGPMKSNKALQGYGGDAGADQDTREAEVLDLDNDMAAAAVTNGDTHVSWWTKPEFADMSTYWADSVHPNSTAQTIMGGYALTATKTALAEP